jgi:hypothetical protein
MHEYDAFRELGGDAPIPRNAAALILATEAVRSYWSPDRRGGLRAGTGKTAQQTDRSTVTRTEACGLGGPRAIAPIVIAAG